MSIIHYGFYNNSYLSNIIFILLLERQHYDSLPVFKPSSDDILIELRNSSQVLVVYFEGRENLNLNFKFQVFQNKSLSLVNKTRWSLSTIGKMMIW